MILSADFLADHRAQPAFVFHRIKSLTPCPSAVVPPSGLARRARGRTCHPRSERTSRAVRPRDRCAKASPGTKAGGQEHQPANAGPGKAGPEPAKRAPHPPTAPKRQTTLPRCPSPPPEAKSSNRNHPPNQPTRKHVSESRGGLNGQAREEARESWKGTTQEPRSEQDYQDAWRA